MDTLRNDNAEPQEEFLTDEEQEAMDGEPEEEGHKRVKAYVDQSTDDIVVAELSDTKFPVVNKNWAKTAKAIFDIYRNDLSCNPATILFLEIKESKAKFKGQPKFFEATTISKTEERLTSPVPTGSSGSRPRPAFSSVFLGKAFLLPEPNGLV